MRPRMLKGTYSKPTKALLVATWGTTLPGRGGFLTKNPRKTLQIGKA